jgi:methylmalonyl-CoA mutase N-terminal domain/subunit
MLAAIAAGSPPRDLERASYEFQKALERGEARVVGVNAHLEDGAQEIPVFRIDPALEREQVAALARRRAARDAARAAASLSALEKGARTSDNLMPLVLEAVRSRATIGEICAALANVFGRHREGAVHP